VLRVGTAVAMKVRDLFPASYRWRLGLHKRSAKRHEVPCHPGLEQNLKGLDYGGESLGIKRSRCSAGHEPGRLLR
jgi:hypothetical protein